MRDERGEGIDDAMLFFSLPPAARPVSLVSLTTPPRTHCSRVTKAQETTAVAARADPAR